MTVDELIDEFVDRCNQTEYSPQLQKIVVMGNMMGTEANQDYMRGALFATQTFRKYLLQRKEELKKVS